jgi:hypothetical protein
VETRVVRCPKCGSSATWGEGARPNLCAHCGAALPWDQIPTKGVRSFPNPSPLKIGMTCLWHGQEYTLTGRIVFRMVEEGEVSYWHEFELISADGHVLFLELDEGKWKMMESFVPQRPIGPVEAIGYRVGSTLNLDGTSARVTEICEAGLHFAEGELTFSPDPSETVHFVDARASNQNYAVEWTTERVEFYRGRPLAEREVLSLFNLREQITKLDALLRRRKARQTFAVVAVALSLFAFIAGAAALNSGKVVSQSAVPIGSVNDDGVRFRIGRLDPRKHIHRLTISGSMSEASAWVAGVLETEDGTELIGTQRDFWDESGYDEGHWHESDLNAKTDFVVRKPGPYFLRLYVERDASRGSFQNVGFRLHEGVLYPSYYFIYGGIVLVIAVLFFALSAKPPTTMPDS